jgi:ribosomal protein L32
MAAPKHESCPECGTTFRAGRLACPECGSDYRTGWKESQEIDYQSVELPDAWPPDEPARRRGWMYVVVLLTVLGMVLWALWW